MSISVGAERTAMSPDELQALREATRAVCARHAGPDEARRLLDGSACESTGRSPVQLAHGTTGTFWLERSQTDVSEADVTGMGLDPDERPDRIATAAIRILEPRRLHEPEAA